MCRDLAVTEKCLGQAGPGRYIVLSATNVAEIPLLLWCNSDSRWAMPNALVERPPPPPTSSGNMGRLDRT